MNILLQYLTTHSYFRFVCIIICTIGSTALAWHNNMHSIYGVDDANIYFVYMQHLANGYGLVYNIGGEHVEGFTSLLWTLIGSLFFRISNSPELYLLVLNILLISYSLWKLSLFTDKLFGKDTLSIHSIILLCCVFLIPGFIEWTILSLMETGLWCSLLTLLILNTLTFSPQDSSSKDSLLFSIMLGLLIITRPESMLWGAFFIIARTIACYRYSQSISASFKNIALPLFAFIIVVICLMIWRLSYFGYPLPNTYYAKVSADILYNIKSGLGYLYRFLSANPIALLTTLTISKFLWDLFIKTIKNRVFIISHYTSIIIIITVISITCVIPLYSGGDHFAYHRFMQATLPFFYIALMLILEVYGIRITRNIAVFLCFFAIISSGFIEAIAGKSPLKHEWRIALEGRQIGNSLTAFFSDESHYPSQGVLVAGGTTFAYKGITIDLMGLNNTAMAHADKIKDKSLLKNHASFNKSVFYQQKPDIFWIAGGFSDSLNLSLLTIADFASTAFKHIELDSTFKEQYVPCSIQKKGNKDILLVYAAFSYIKSLDTSLYSILIH